MPSIWFTGISHSLNSAPSSSSVKLAHQQLVAGLLLVGQPGGIDRRQPHQEVLSSRASSSFTAFTRVVGDLVVVALVADERGKLGIVLEVVFPVVVEEVVERLAAVVKRDRNLRHAGQSLRAAGRHAREGAWR